MAKLPQVIDERVYHAMALRLLALDGEKRKELLNEMSVSLRTRLEIEIVRVFHNDGMRIRRYWTEQFGRKPRPGVAPRALELLQRFRPANARATRRISSGAEADSWGSSDIGVLDRMRIFQAGAPSIDSATPR
ncbi:MAG: hypothetical protein ACREFP_25810 [Acetobacteraceae bacterium]